MQEEKMPFDSVEKNKILPGVLYLVATPIGNLADLSPRAQKILAGVDLIAAEDTRNAQKLLSCFGIHGKECISYFEHNKKGHGEMIIARLQAGASCALITDAGTPAVSDPGEDIVRLCAEHGIPVTAAPGCCAAVNALSLSGLPTGRFAFEGFLSASAGERKKQLERVKKEERTLIFYEAPHKLLRTLQDMHQVFGNRQIALCREMTKLNEEIMRTTLEDAITHYTEKVPRGEYVLILEGSTEAESEKDAWFAELSPEEHVKAYEERGLSRMDATKAAAKDRGMSKSALYKLLHC